MHDVVGVGGENDSSTIGIASDSQSKDVGVSGGKQSRHGGREAGFFHMSMCRLLIEDKPSMLNGELPKLCDQIMRQSMKKIV